MRHASMMLLTVFILSVGSTVLAGPRLVVCQNEVIISEPVPAGETIEGVFRLCNKGDAQVRIMRVSPG